MATNNEHAICALLQCLEDEVDVESGSARHADDPRGRVILELHGPCKVGGGVHALHTAENYDVHVLWWHKKTSPIANPKMMHSDLHIIFHI